MKNPQRILIHIAFNLPTERLFTYSLPPDSADKAAIGQRALVPFGRRRLIGYIMDINVSGPEPGIAVKPIKALLDDESFFDKNLLKLTRWIGEYYCCPLGMVLESCLPPGLKGKNILTPKEQKYFRLAVSAEDALALAEKIAPRAPRQARVLRLLAEKNSALSGVELEHYSALKALCDKGILSAFQKETKPRMYYGQRPDSGPKPILTPHQAAAFERVKTNLNDSEFACSLLHGITGSGKTEVYLRSIEYAVSLGRQALVLVPEIALTPQLVERFKARFPSQIAILHSQLNNRERTLEWRRLQRGEAAIGIGVRAAVLTPMPRLGLIVVDEEHENSYKQDNMPRYHARDVAIMRASLEKIPIMVGSATPSLESFYNTQLGKARLLDLPRRIGKSELPPVRLVDLRELKSDKGPPLLSPQLLAAIEQRLERGEQSLIFLNRRGHYSCALCRECGDSVKCPQCSVSLTYHSHGNRLRCHYCDYTLPPLEECPQCKGSILTYSGLGTQLLEKELQKRFPQARIMRMDRDSTRHKGAHWDCFEALKDEKVDILLGTQMVTKGFDLPKITLVGVVAADLILNFPDFRAAEKTFQLLTQVAGRAGRGELKGEAIIQTFMPEHYSIQAACKHDYQGFYEVELKFRKALCYPPYCRIANLLVRGRDDTLSFDVARKLAGHLRCSKIKGLIVLGAVQAPIAKLRGEHRWQILLKAPSASVLGEGLKRVREYWETERNSTRLRLDVDVDAVSLL